MLSPGDWIHLVVDAGLIGAVWFLAHDQDAITARLKGVEEGNEREDKAEHQLHDEGTQLRSELDYLHAGMRMLAKANRARDPITDWNDGTKRETLEGAFAPPSQPNDTRVWSPNAPKLPRFINPDAECCYCECDPCTCPEYQ